MFPSHSWKWLVARHTAKEMFGGTSSTGRSADKPAPCLPTIDSLGDRLLLSAAPGKEIVIGPGGPGEGSPDSTAILAELLRGQLPLVESQLDLLKIASVELQNKIDLQVHKLTGTLLKINSLLYKFGETQIKFGFDEFKYNKIVESLDRGFSKIDSIAAPGGTGEGLLLPAVQKVREAATSLLDDLRLLDGGELSHKEQQTYLKISDAFLKIDQAILKTQENLILERKAGGKQQEFLIIKMNDILISSRIDDKELQDLIQGLAKSTTGILIGLLQPTDTGDVITG